MNWSEVIETVADAAPLLGKLLPIPGAGIAGTLIASAFGAKNDKASIAAALAADPDAALKLATIEENNRVALEGQVIAAETARLQTVNETIRAETASDDPVVRRWRPVFGYIVGISWGCQVFVISLAIIWAVIDKTVNVAELYGGIAEIISSMTVMWAIALSVLGVSVHKRSQDKAVAAGQPPGGIVKTLLGQMAGS